MCLAVELNTWFLILRRVWHVPLVSVCFYVSWISIRLCVYPYLIYELGLIYVQRSVRVGWINHFVLLPVIQSVFTLLNVKWTVDLVKRKRELWRDPGLAQAENKGL